MEPKEITCPHCNQKIGGVLQALKHKCLAPKPKPESREVMYQMIRKLSAEDIGK
jgi:hypothetical protein